MKCYIILIIIFHFISLHSQIVTKVTGRITDYDTGEPLQFVNIFIKGTQIGTITDEKGRYSLEINIKCDSITASIVGYKSVTKPIKYGRFQTVDFKLKPIAYTLSEINVIDTKKRKKHKDTLALELIEKVLKNKKKYDIDNFDYIDYETYNKIQFDLNNINDNLLNNKILKQFSFVRDYIDTSTIDNRPFLPIFFYESHTKFYKRREPKDEKEYIIATRASGVKDKSISQLMGNMYIKFNFYDNYIDFFGKGFISPIASLGRLYYRYYLIDSAIVESKKMYNIAFVPKIKQENVFSGSFWVVDSAFAISKLEFKIGKEVNINFVNNLIIKQEYQEVEGKYWLLSKEQIVVDFNLFKDPNEAIGFYGKKTTYYKNYNINIPHDKNVYEPLVDIIVDNNVTEHRDSYWDSIRVEPLSQKEKGIFEMVDSIKNIRAFRTFYDIMNMIVTYYHVWGKVEIGPYFTFYSYNTIEGNRLKIGMRTSNEFSKKTMLEGYLAYGTRDGKFKEGFSFLHYFKKIPERSLSFSIMHDLEQLGQSINAFREDNILTSAFRRGPQNTLSPINKIETSYEHEWKQNYSTTVGILWQQLYPFKGQIFLVGNKYFDYFITNEFFIKTRIAYNEKFIMGEFERVSLGTKYPIIIFLASKSFKRVLFSDFDYEKLQLSIEHWFNIYPFGWSSYYIEGGKIFGRLPYPLLKLHEGNQTYFFDPFAFNLMNYYEFVSDQWLSFSYTHYFDGFFLNKLPFLRQLKLRELMWGKSLFGNINAENVNYMLFPPNLFTLDRKQNINKLKPYIEVGVGIENIFRFVRVDFVWRLSYLNHPNISKYGLRFSMQFKF
ncbi:MAG: DUF5686 and carboxypeptidase regulatory-like domain-containing protein [Bacteroidales bacterium]|nr:DUF5686 and carboxypeptidase regulatory-like domain-containing protein [Bacteroidales bacterium]